MSIWNLDAVHWALPSPSFGVSDSAVTGAGSVTETGTLNIGTASDDRYVFLVVAGYDLGHDFAANQPGWVSATVNSVSLDLLAYFEPTTTSVLGFCVFGGFVTTGTGNVTCVATAYTGNTWDDSAMGIITLNGGPNLDVTDISLNTAAPGAAVSDVVSGPSNSMWVGFAMCVNGGGWTLSGGGTEVFDFDFRSDEFLGGFYDTGFDGSNTYTATTTNTDGTTTGNVHLISGLVSPI